MSSVKRFALALVGLLVLFSSCTGARSKGLSVVGPGPAGNGESYFGTQYLETLLSGVWPALIKSLEEIDGNPSGDHCSCPSGNPLCLPLSGLTETQEKDCSEYVSRMAPIVLQRLRAGTPQVIFSEKPLTVINSRGESVPVTATTAPGQPIRVHAGTILAFAQKGGVLGAVLGHEVLHLIEDPEAPFDSEKNGRYRGDEESYLSFSRTATLLNAAGTYFMSNAIGKGFYQEENEDSTEGTQDDGDTGGANGNAPVVATLSCSLALVSAQPTISVDQGGVVLGLSSTGNWRVTANLSGVGLAAIQVNRGGTNLRSATSNGNQISFSSDYTVSGGITLTATVQHSASNQSAQCSLPFSVAAVPAQIPTRPIYRMFAQATGDQLFTPNSGEGSGAGYQPVGNSWKVYTTPTPSCSVEIYTTVHPSGFHSLSVNPAAEGHSPKYFMGYCCGGPVGGTALLHRLTYSSRFLGLTAGIAEHQAQGWIYEGPLCYTP